MTDWAKKNINEISELLKSHIHGLNSEDVQRRLDEVGPNKLPEAKPDSFFVIFLKQFQSPLIYVLLVASATVFALGDIIDGFIILFVLIFNAVIGSIQEGKAQSTLLALKKFVETEATVLRDGKEIIVKGEDLVPGDVVILSEGQKIPADARIIGSHNLRVDESALTGESEPVDKYVDLPEELLKKNEIQPSEAKNLVFKGTNIVAGNGRAIIVATGLETVIGKISKKIASIDTEIPLRANIRSLAKFIIIGVIILSVFLFASGILWFEKTAIEMFKLVVALSVSFIPEGLPVAITLILVMGVWRMAKRNALVKKLQAVEALGQAKVIAVDKTGTITRNEMVVQKVLVGGKIFIVSGEGYSNDGEFFLDEKIILPADSQELLLAGKSAAFVANARVSFDEENEAWHVSGDPTEAAILVLGQKAGFKKDEWTDRHELLDEMPFDYKLKYSAVIRRDEEEKSMLVVVGAPEAILEKCDRIWMAHDNFEKITEERRKEIKDSFKEMSREGLRVLAFGMSYDPPDRLDSDNLPKIVLGGFYGMKDALRAEVKEAMERAKEAGVRVVMITGDHRLTAEAIAKEADIYHKGENILTGKEIEEMGDKELDKAIGQTTVFARVTPEHKLRIVQSFKRSGFIIAMTGDGVNDAPSLVAADLGIAMGKAGTEVAKEASDIILLDDNFGSIISAIEEGKSIYRTIRKVLQYLFSTNFSEILIISIALFLGYPLPLLAGQIIWLNFVTDGFLVASLAMEPKEEGLLKRKTKKGKGLIDVPLFANSLFIALVITTGCILVFMNYVNLDLIKAQTMVLTTLAMFNWFRVWNARSEDESIFRIPLFSNKFLIGATLLVILLQLGAVYLPFMHEVLGTTPLTLVEWMVIVTLALSVFVAEELRKFVIRTYRFLKGFTNSSGA